MTEQNILIYKTENNNVELKVQLKKEIVWLTQAQMAELFDKDRNTISEHIQNVFNEGELIEDLVTRKFRATASDGKTYMTNHYNLDVVISVGYRVKSLRGTQSRIWATNVLRKYTVDGYAINSKRLQENNKKYHALQTQLTTLRKVIENEDFNLEQSKELVRIITDYSESLELLDKFDHQDIELPKKLSTVSSKEISYSILYFLSQV